MGKNDLHLLQPTQCQAQSQLLMFDEWRNEWMKACLCWFIALLLNAHSSSYHNPESGNDLRDVDWVRVSWGLQSATLLHFFPLNRLRSSSLLFTVRSDSKSVVNLLSSWGSKKRAGVVVRVYYLLHYSGVFPWARTWFYFNAVICIRRGSSSARPKWEGRGARGELMEK